MRNDGRNDGADTDDHEKIENVRSDNISKGNITVSGDARGNTHRSFRSAGAHGDNGQSDDDGRNIHNTGERRGTIYKEIGTFD